MRHMMSIYKIICVLVISQLLHLAVSFPLALLTYDNDYEVDYGILCSSCNFNSVNICYSSYKYISHCRKTTK